MHVARHVGRKFKIGNAVHQHGGGNWVEIPSMPVRCTNISCLPPRRNTRAVAMVRSGDVVK
jgi:hypothetical protein